MLRLSIWVSFYGGPPQNGPTVFLPVSLQNRKTRSVPLPQLHFLAASSGRWMRSSSLPPRPGQRVDRPAALEAPNMGARVFVLGTRFGVGVMKGKPRGNQPVLLSTLGGFHQTEDSRQNAGPSNPAFCGGGIGLRKEVGSPPSAQVTRSRARGASG